MWGNFLPICATQGELKIRNFLLMYFRFMVPYIVVITLIKTPTRCTLF